MNELGWIIIGVICALVIAFIAYITQVFIRIIVNKNRIKNTLAQISGQVDVKHNLLKEYLKLNKDGIVDETFNKINVLLNEYESSKEKDVDTLKEFNSSYVTYMKSFDDSLLCKQCDESEEKINYIKEYYNELVCFFNRYKSNGVNVILSKALSINDAKLY